MSSLKMVESIENIKHFGKFSVKLECGHKYIFDHNMTKMVSLPKRLPCKICFGQHK